MSDFSRTPPLSRDERNEAAAQRHRLDGAVLGPHDRDEPLSPRAATREDEPAADRELVVERRRHPVGGGGDRDRVERRPVGSPEPAVADPDLDRGVTGLLERGARPDGERLETLDRGHVRGELVEHGGRVARARADVEHALGAVELEQRAHLRDDVRLRDRLALADRERRVVVRVPREVPAGTNSSRGTASMAARTRSSEIPRRRSWRSTIRARSSAASTSRRRSRRPPEDVRRRRDAEVAEHERRHVDDAPRGLRLEAHGQHRDERVRRDE